jgi:hypothetical protein
MKQRSEKRVARKITGTLINAEKSGFSDFKISVNQI